MIATADAARNNDPLIDGFCDALWLEDGLARTTLDSYRSDLLLLQRLLPGASNIAVASEAQLAHALAEFSRDHKRTSQARLLSTLRRFFGWLAANGQRTDDPSLKLARPARSRQRPASLPARRPKGRAPTISPRRLRRSASAGPTTARQRRG